MWAKNFGVSLGCIFFHNLQPITIFFLLALKSTTHAQSQHFHILAINVQWCVLANVKEGRCTCVLTLLLIWDTGHILKHIESKFCLLVCDWYAVRNFQYPMQTTSSFIYDELLGINPLSPYYDLSRPVFLLGVSRRRQSLDSFQFPKQNTLVGFALYLFLFRRILARKYKWHLQSIVGTLKVTTIEGGEKFLFHFV